jgi:ribonuclease P protein component
MPGNPSVRLGFPRSSRLKQTGDFARARANGLRLVCGCLIANVAQRPSNLASRLGVVTSKKIGGAVVRSRARRLLRESFRLHQSDLARPVDLVLIARPSIVGKGLAEVERDFLRAVKQARLEKPLT